MGFLNRLDRPHRLFTVCAASWAVVAPWLVADTCWPGTLRWTLMNRLGALSECRGVTGDFVTVLAVSALPCLLAYVAAFVAIPAASRWVAAGEQ